MHLFTIGFTQRSAEEFFEALRRAKVRRVIDVRLHNTSQLAAFAKRDDLAYFAKRICDADYLHELLLAPTEEALAAYRAKKLKWVDYEVLYTRLLEERRAADVLDRRLFDGAALLCSERTAERCHRRVAAEFLASRWNDIAIRHL